MTIHSNAELSRTVTLRTGETVTFAARWDELTEGVRAALENAAADAVHAPMTDDPEFMTGSPITWSRRRRSIRIR